jgi:hypothetical protein
VSGDSPISGQVKPLAVILLQQVFDSFGKQFHRSAAPLQIHIMLLAV